ncbi:MAG TPA: M20/M25/M40 family metallo-hydrolase [Thermomicrobiales bacterium]
MATLDVVRLTRELVAIDSVSKHSNAAIADALEPVMRRSGFEVERLEYRDAKGEPKIDLVGLKGPGTGGLGFLSHVDTVPGAGWDRDPWAPVVEGDHLIGLGSCDMKGPLAATLVAAASVDTARLVHPILIAATADEEISLQGAKEVLARSELFRAAELRHGVVAEPTRMTPVYAHKGGAMVSITAHGVAAHTSTDRGVSANFLIAPFLAEMAEFAAILKTDSSYHRPEFDPPTNGFNMTLDDGGCKQNVTAPKTVCTLSFRPMPNDRSADVMAFITERAHRHELEISTELFPPFSVSPDAAIVRAALAATGATKAETVPYGTEATYYQNALELVILGPGDIAQAHTNGEWISIAQLHDAVGTYSRMIENLCGG